MKRMKRTIAWILCLCMGLSVRMACADTDKEIQLSGHTFGETMAQAIQGRSVGSIHFNSPFTSRLIADPLTEEISTFIIGYGERKITYDVRLEERDGPNIIAGYQGVLSLYYYFPSLEDSEKLNLMDGIFYAGDYIFYNDAPKIYEDLKVKLTSVYGEPIPETTNGDDIWGPASESEDLLSGKGYVAQLEQLKSDYNGTKMTAWKSSANSGMIVLTLICCRGQTYTSLMYADTAADKIILELNEAGNNAVKEANGLEGL